MNLMGLLVVIKQVLQTETMKQSPLYLGKTVTAIIATTTTTTAVCSE